MKKRLSIIMCIALVFCLTPTASAFAAKAVKSKSVSMSPKSMTIAIGDVAQLNATMSPSGSTDKLTWSSSNKAVASVTSKGMVQGKSEGTATITVKTSNKKTAKCSVVVKKYATSKDILSAIDGSTYAKSEIDSKISSSEASAREFATSDEAATTISEKLKSTFATYDSVLASIGQSTYTKSEIDSLIGGIPTDEFATKDELSKLSSSVYTKNEVDSLIAALPVGDACDCAIKTEADVVSIIKQNTYTKEEIDAMIAAASSGHDADWEDGAELQLFPGQSLPIEWNGVTIESISVKKYRKSVLSSEDNYAPFKVSVSAKGTFALSEQVMRSSGLNIALYKGDVATGWLSADFSEATIDGDRFEIKKDLDVVSSLGDSFLISYIWVEDH